MDPQFSRKEQVPMNVADYRGYANLPPLVGLQSMSEAVSRGLTVAQSVARQLRLHWSLRRLNTILVSRIAATPIYELKMAFSLHAHLSAEHVEPLASRVREMRQPPYGLEVCPDAALDAFFDEIQCAKEVPALVLGLYAYAFPAIVRALERVLADTNKLFDHPTWRICRFSLLEIQDVLEYGQQAVSCLVDDQARASLAPWTALLEELLAQAGDLDGTQPKTSGDVRRMFSAVACPYDGVPQRDERFRDSYNMGVNAEAFLFDPQIPAIPKSIMLYFKRLREIDVPEMMSSILVETPGKPWAYYRDMTRQLWDEARHAMMGEIGFVSMGINWTKIPLNFTWSLGLNTQLTPLERHGVLYTIEQGLMPKKTGKEYEWQVALATANPLTSMMQDYDWADEILHARIGRDWLVPEIGTQKEALAFGDRAWSRILVDWSRWREQGLTEHRNWWPDVYRDACRYWGVEPDPALLAYDTTYENTRADLKQVAG
jgi:hypothetical protein